MKAKPISECRTVAELLATSRRWCRDEAAMTAHGVGIAVNAVGAARFCLYGALSRVYPDSKRRSRAELRLVKALKAVSPLPDIVTYNDAYTHAHVLALVKKARV